MTKLAHTTDSDCDVDPKTYVCRGCGISHAGECIACNQRGYHAPGCTEWKTHKAPPAPVPAPPAEIPIVVQVTRYVWRHESVLGEARVVRGAPYVLAWHDSRAFEALLVGLALTGHAFNVEIVDQEVSLLEILDRRANTPQPGKTNAI